MKNFIFIFSLLLFVFSSQTSNATFLHKKINYTVVKTNDVIIKNSSTTIAPNEKNKPKESKWHRFFKNDIKYKRTNICSLIGFISIIVNIFFFALIPISIIFSIIGIIQCKNRKQKGIGFAIAGLILSFLKAVLIMIIPYLFK